MTYLAPQHQDMLRESGLTPATIAARGYASVNFRTGLKEYGFSDWQAKQVPALLIPIYDVFGKLNMYQMRPDAPPVIEGKPLKYMTPKGGQLCLDVPRAVQPLLADVSVPLWITEGSKKVDCGAQHGLCILGALGVTGWMRDGLPLPDWKQITLQKRSVYLAFDADARTKRPVWLALQTLKVFLEGQGARVLIIYLPDDPADPTKKIGLDDYLAAGHSSKDLQALASPDLPPPPSQAGSRPRNPLEQLRADALTRKLADVVEVHPHGGMKVKAEAQLQAIGKAAKNTSYFYGRMEDMKKWDLIDLWIAARGKIPYQQRQAWKAAHFGRFARPLGDWVSAVGAFAENKDERRRPHLPIWLHEFVKNLTPEQQETVFDNFEGAGRMLQSEVATLIATLTGTEDKKQEGEKQLKSPARPKLDWDAVAQHFESVEDIGSQVAPHMLRLTQTYGDRGAAEKILAIPVDAPDASPWEGMDVYDAPPVREEAEAEETEGDFWQTEENEIENSRQNSGQTFGSAKVCGDGWGAEAAAKDIGKTVSSEQTFVLYREEGEESSSLYTEPKVSAALSADPEPDQTPQELAATLSLALRPFALLLDALVSGTLPRTRICLPDGSEVTNLSAYVREQKRLFDHEPLKREKARAELALCQAWYDAQRVGDAVEGG